MQKDWVIAEVSVIGQDYRRERNLTSTAFARRKAGSSASKLPELYYTNTH